MDRLYRKMTINGSFFYMIYTFLSTTHCCLTNTVFALNCRNSVLMGLWFSDVFHIITEPYISKLMLISSLACLLVQVIPKVNIYMAPDKVLFFFFIQTLHYFLFENIMLWVLIRTEALLMSTHNICFCRESGAM